MEKALMGVMALMFGLVMFAAVAGMIEAAEPVAEFICPICGDAFFTYDELYNHFVTEHPAEDITILWT